MPHLPDPGSRYAVTDVEALRALTHPLRARLLAELRLHGAATASQLGRTLGESSGATSYHLRQLERYGFIHEAPEQASRREREWCASHAMTSIDPSRFLGTDGQDVVDEISGRQVSRLVDQSATWLATRTSWSAEWVSSAGYDDTMARLSPAACARLHERLLEVVAELERESREDPAAQWVSVFLAAIPQTHDQVGT